MKTLQEFINESLIEENISENEIDSFVNSWLKSNGFNLDFNFKELFKIYKAINSSFRKQDIFDSWLFIDDSPDKVDSLMHKEFDILNEHPDWSLRELVAYWETANISDKDDKLHLNNEPQFNYILDKINKKLG